MNRSGPNPLVDVEGLSNTEVEAVKGFVAYVRTPEGKRELASAGFTRFWNDWKQHAPASTDQEAQELADEAVAFARGRA